MTAIPDIPAWSENYCFDGYDPVAGAGVWLHIGRWPRNPLLWREQVLVYLPGGDQLVMRGFGSHPVEDGVGSAQMKFQCLEPGKTWRLSFSGAARRTTARAMIEDTEKHLSDGPFTPAAFDLVFTASHAPWDMGVLDGENWCTAHYEQHGRMRGTIRYRDSDDVERTVRMEGNAYRDHSRGPRDLANFAAFYWLHAQFPGGRAFAVVESYKIVDGVRSRGAAKAVVFDQDRIFSAEVDRVPLVRASNLSEDRYELTLRSELGDMHMQARLLRTMAMSADRYMDQFDGVATPKVGLYFGLEQPTEFIWGDLVTNGWTERAERC